MAFFVKKNPMEKLEAELKTLRARAGQLTAKRSTAQAALDRATAARQEFLLGGDIDDDKTSTKLQAAVDSATSSLAGFDTAIAALGASIADVEAKLTEARQAADRLAASEKLAAQILKIDETLPAWLQLTRSLAGAFESISWRAELAQMAHYIRNVASEIENAERLTFPDLHAAVGHIRDGRLPIPRDLEIFVPPPVSKPELVQVFALFALAWTDHHGMQRQIGKWHDIELPRQAAERALRLKLACPMSDPRRKQFHGQAGGRHPEPNWINDLDRETGPDIARSSEVSAVEVIRHSAFETPTVGPAQILKIAVPTR
jgi:hypothetical protein